MNRIDTLFQRKKNKVLSIYFTAGYPQLNDTAQIIQAMTEQGVDMIEIGIPFSDPLADGVVIQQSGQKALENGMNLKLLFEQLKDIRKATDIPLLMMGYINPVMQYGVENFCKKCKEIGIDGVILPDLPLHEYQQDYEAIFKANSLHNIFLVTPQTSPERIKMIDEISSGFIYVVSSSATTGAKAAIENKQEEYFSRIKSMGLKNPLLIGFGISDHQTFAKACEYANGGIIGSAFIKAVGAGGNVAQLTKDFVKGIVN